MKLLKIVLIIALLIVISSASSLGIGTITSGDKIVDMTDIKEMYGSSSSTDIPISIGIDPHWAYIREEAEEPNSLNEWFKNLSVTEKMKLYTYWHGLNHKRDEFDDRLIWLEERVKEIEVLVGDLVRFTGYDINHWKEVNHE